MAIFMNHSGACPQRCWFSPVPEMTLMRWRSSKRCVYLQCKFKANRPRDCCYSSYFKLLESSSSDGLVTLLAKAKARNSPTLGILSGLLEIQQRRTAIVPLQRFKWWAAPRKVNKGLLRCFLIKEFQDWFENVDLLYGGCGSVWWTGFASIYDQRCDNSWGDKGISPLWHRAYYSRL